MKTKECPSCAMEVESSSEVCPICGYEFPRIKSVYRWLAIFLIVLFVLYLIF